MKTIHISKTDGPITSKDIALSVLDDLKDDGVRGIMVFLAYDDPSTPNEMFFNFDDISVESAHRAYRSLVHSTSKLSDFIERETGERPPL